MIIDERFESLDQEGCNVTAAVTCTLIDMGMITLQLQSLGNMDFVFDEAAHIRLKTRLVGHIGSRFRDVD